MQPKKSEKKPEPKRSHMPKPSQTLRDLADTMIAAYATSIVSGFVDNLNASAAMMRAEAAKLKTERVKLAVDAFDQASRIASLKTEDRMLILDEVGRAVEALKPPRKGFLESLADMVGEAIAPEAGARAAKPPPADAPATTPEPK